MNKELFVKVMNGVGKVYDRNLDQETLEIWLSFFNEDNIEDFKLAINNHIKTSSKFPTIADIKNQIYESKHKQMDNNDLWEKLHSAIGRSSYYSEEEFEKLPELVKLYVRNPRQLQDMASMDSDVINSVVKGQFLKQIENIKRDYKEGEITNRNLLQEKSFYQLENMEEL